MDTISAFANGLASRGEPLRVFDWLKAAEIIRDKSLSDASFRAYAGLLEDLEWTEGLIFDKGAPVPREQTYTYLASRWATPVLWDGSDWVECFLMESECPEWNEETYWPNEALEILNQPAEGQ